MNKILIVCLLLVSCTRLTPMESCIREVENREDITYMFHHRGYTKIEWSEAIEDCVNYRKSRL